MRPEELGKTKMIITHLNKTPAIDPSAYVAPNATVCGDVQIARGCRIMFGACVASEGAPLRLGRNCIVMENAVIRATTHHALTIGSHCLIGPHAHLAGCTLEDSVFIATGVTVLHGAHISFGAEVRINAVVHLRTRLPAHTTVPIGWIAVGDPAQLFPPHQHEAIWAIQKPLNFPQFVYGVERSRPGETNMDQITSTRSKQLASHATDTISS